MDARSDLNIFLDEFGFHIKLLEEAFLTSGLKEESIKTDKDAVQNFVAQPSLKTIEELFFRIQNNKDANARRVGAGSGGVALFVGMGLTMFIPGVNVVTAAATPFIAGTAAVGALASAGVAIDADRKRGDLAVCEEKILHAVLKKILDENKYQLYASIQLNFFLLEAQYVRKTQNSARDVAVNCSLSNLAAKTDFHGVYDELCVLKENLFRIRSSSKIALEVEQLIKNIYKKNCNVLMSEKNFKDLITAKFNHVLALCSNYQNLIMIKSSIDVLKTEFVFCAANYTNITREKYSDLVQQKYVELNKTGFDRYAELNEIINEIYTYDIQPAIPDLASLPLSNMNFR